jgi:uncharacterized protein YlxP (DUF503 family)
MYVIFGEENVRLLDLETHNHDCTLSFDDFHKKYGNADNCKIIIDRGDVDFSLENLINCSLAEARKICRCERDHKSQNTNVFLAPKDEIVFLGKCNYRLQKYTLNIRELEEKIRANADVFLAEYAIEFICRKMAYLDDDSQWLYAANHQSSGTKIVAGIGKGILLSRIIPTNNISTEITKTIRYLKRFGLSDSLKIITTLDDVPEENCEIIKISPQKISQRLGLQNSSDIELIMGETIAKNADLMAYFMSGKYWHYILSVSGSKIYGTQLIFLLAFAAWFAHLGLQIDREMAQITFAKKSLATSIKDQSQSVEFKIDDSNFSFVNHLIDILRNGQNPIKTIAEIAPILRKNGIFAHEILLKKCNEIKIKTAVTRDILLQLQNFSNKKFKITVEMENNAKKEYEEISFGDFSAEKIGVVVCIKTK